MYRPFGEEDKGAEAVKEGSAESATEGVEEPLEKPNNDASDFVLGIPEASAINNLVQQHPLWSSERWSSSCLPFLFFESEREESNSRGLFGRPSTANDVSEADRDRHLEMALRNVRAMDDDVKGRLCTASREYLYMLIASLALHCLDIWTDALVAINHFMKMRIGYGTFTIFLMLAPRIVFFLEGVFWMFYLEEKKSWRSLILNKEYIFRRMIESVEYALKSRMDFCTVAYDYELFDKRRRGEEYQGKNLEDWNSGIKMLCKELSAKRDLDTIRLRCNASLLHSAPQALLQLYYCFVINPDDGYERLLFAISVSTSIVNVAWSIHKAHFELHFQDGWVNDMETTGSLEFFGILFTKCARILCLARLILLTRILFTVAWLGYLILLILTLCYMTTRARLYQRIFSDSSYIPWPIYRMFTLSVEVGLWKLDSVDHVLYFLETLLFAVVIILLEEVNLIFAAIFCIGYVLGLMCLISFKVFFHKNKLCMESIIT